MNPDVLVLCHGGPIAEPADAQYVLERTEGVVGFFGASSIERLPTEVAIREQTEKFKAVTVVKDDDHFTFTMSMIGPGGEAQPAFSIEYTRKK